MVSFDPISVPRLSILPATSAKKISSEVRVPEPGSRTRNFSAAISSLEMSRFPRQRMIRRRDDDERMIAEQKRLDLDVARRASHHCDVDRLVAQGVDGLGRLPSNSSMSISGLIFWKAAIRRGVKYFAVETAPSFRVPRLAALEGGDLLFQHAQALLNRVCRVEDSLACGSRTHPFRCAVEQRQAVSSSSCLSCNVTAGPVSPNCLAANEIFPVCSIMSKRTQLADGQVQHC
jgi:hypothetical protein